MPSLPPQHNAATTGARQHTGKTKDYSSWYGLKAWFKIRAQRLRLDLWTCQMCGKNWGHNPSKLVVDHKRPHRGVWSLFIDIDNTQTLCASPCHNRHKQAMEQWEINRE